jgi:hypothetical protein
MKNIWICFVIMLSCAACNKCGHCELSGTSDNYYCQGSSKEIYEATKKVCESGGGNWVVK